MLKYIAVLLVVCYLVASQEQAATETTTTTPVVKFDKSRAVFLDTFEQDPKSNGWIESNDEKYQGQEWKWDEAPGNIKGFDGDKGIIIGKEAKHYGLAHAVKIDNKDKDFVFQYEVKYEKPMQCGGSYVKLLADNKDLDLNTFTDKSPYVIMFGPDFCGSATDKVHFILRLQNPVSKQWEEKHMKGAPLIKNDQFSHLYTLIVRKDNTFEVLIDNESVKKGSLFEDFEPSVIPPKEIDDPNDKQPADWVTEEFMDDPEAKKPQDWDEDAPMEIVDAEDKKPETWLDNEPAQIADPNTVKPVDWNDEEDGKWEAPIVENPKCKEFGCGEWKPRMIRNPNYKGKWKAPKVKNPAYQGTWRAKQIPNPNYFEDKNPAALPSIGAIAFEIWTMQNNILFDNVFIGYDPAAAKEFAEQTWRSKFNKQKEQAPKPESTGDATNPVELIKNFVMTYPIPIIGTILAILISIPLFCCRGGDISSKDDTTEASSPTSSKLVAEPAEESKKEDATTTTSSNNNNAAPAVEDEKQKTPTKKRKNANKTQRDE